MNSRSIVSARSRVLLLLLVVVALGGGEAWAKKRIVVVKFPGRAAQAQREVEALVKKDNTVVSDAAMRRAQKRLKVRRLNDSGYARLAADLTADAFITGALQRRRGGRYNLALTLRDGKTGAVTETIDVPLKRARVDSAARADLAMKLEPALAKVGALSDEPLEITPPSAPVSAGPGSEDTEAAPLTGVKPPPPPRADEATAGTALVARAELPDQRRARHAAAEVSVGATVVRRKLTFTSTDELTPSQRPNGYNGSVVPSVTVNGEVYPLAFGSPSGALSGLGVAFVFDRVIGLKSRLGSTEYTTTQQKVGGGLRYRWNLGNKATQPTVKFIAGFNALSFEIDRGADDIDLPNFSYTYLDVGAAGRFPVGSPMFAIYLDARYNQVFGSGEVTEQAFYGDGGARGFEGDGGLEVRLLDDKLVVRLGAHYQRIAFDFDGNGVRSNNRDGNPANQDVGGALDQYLSGYLTAGWVF
jgi:hypothetical protein